MIADLLKRRRAKAAPPTSEPIVSAPAEPEASPPGLPATVGRIDLVERRTVSGVAAPDGHEPARVLFTAGDRLIGQAQAHGPATGDPAMRGFKTELDIDTAAEVRAHRQSDGIELEGSPFLLAPLPVAAVPAWSVRAEIVKPLQLGGRTEAALLATSSRTGALKPHLLPYLAAFRQAGMAIILVATTERPLNLPPALVDEADAVLVRHRRGHAFGAWAHALRFWPELWGVSTLYLLDDSIPLDDPESLARTIECVRASDADLVGITESYDPVWHPERGLLAAKPRLLATGEMQQYWGDALFEQDEPDSWRDLVELAQLVTDLGRGIEILCPNDAALDRPIAAAADGLPPTDERLVARGSTRGGGLHGIALYGQWDEPGNDGDAARNLLMALRQAGLPLALHWTASSLPRSLAVQDFHHPPDMAIVVLPLGAADLARVPSAPLRVGWWISPDMPTNEDVAGIDALWLHDAAKAERLRGILDVPVVAMPLDAPAVLADALKSALARPRPSYARQPAPLRPGLLAGWRFLAEQLTAEILFVPLNADGSLGDRARAAFAQAQERDADLWFAFAPEGTLRSPLFGCSVAAQIRARPDAAILYGDDIAVETDEPIDQLRLKPDFDRTLLAAQDYVGAPVLVRASVLAQLGLPAVDRGTAVMADLLFRADAADLVIARIPDVLIAHPGKRVRAHDDDYLAMLRAQPQLAGFDVGPGLEPGSFAMMRRFEPGTEPHVTIVIPTMRGGRPGELPCIERLLDALRGTDWPMDRLTVLIGDDIPGEPDWARTRWPFALRRIETVRAEGERFNYAAKMNRLWREAGSEQIVLMNDDIVPCDGGWLRALLTFSTQERVGGVGARLLFEDGTLQHAGLVPHNAGAAHAWIHRSRLAGTYQGWARVHREWSMVTGALFATRRSVLARMDGFDERFSLEFNDSDLCLRMRAIGYRIVCTPHAELVHLEKVSRGDALPPGNELALFRSRWSGWLDQDPSWHPGLRRDRLQLAPKPVDGAWYL